MRVTANTFPDTLVNQLGLLAIRQNRLQSQAATGQRVRLPEDDPTAMRRVLDLKDETAALSQYRRNISTLKEYATASYDAMSALKKISARAGEIATLADGTKSPEELQTYAIEINQLISQGVQLANAKNHGDYLFAGTATNKPPFVIDSLGANGEITGVSYQGNTTVPASEIAEATTISVQVPGANNTGADLAQTLVRLSETPSAYQAALQSGATILNQSLLDYLQ